MTRGIAMKKFFRWTKVVRETSGSQIAEAALVLPLAFMILLGIYWFGRAFNTYATIIDAAREGARSAVSASCATCASPNNPPTPASVATVVTQTMQASSVDPSQIQLYAPPFVFCNSLTQGQNCSSSSNVTVCNSIQLTPVSSPPACGVSVSFQYPYQFWLPFTSLNNQQLILTADVQMRGEY